MPTRSASTTPATSPRPATSPSWRSRLDAQPTLRPDGRTPSKRCYSRGRTGGWSTNRNLLASRYPVVDGVKTGPTLDARYVLAGADHAPGGARVVSVVLGEPSEAARDPHTSEPAALRAVPLPAAPRSIPRRAVVRVKIKDRGGRAALLPARAVTLTCARGQRVGRRIEAPRTLDGPLPARRRVGGVVLCCSKRAPRRTVALKVYRRSRTRSGHALRTSYRSWASP